jgi:hypothetical protein
MLVRPLLHHLGAQSPPVSYTPVTESPISAYSASVGYNSCTVNQSILVLSTLRYEVFSQPRRAGSLIPPDKLGSSSGLENHGEAFPGTRAGSS